MGSWTISSLHTALALEWLSGVRSMTCLWHIGAHLLSSCCLSCMVLQRCNTCMVPQHCETLRTEGLGLYENHDLLNTVMHCVKA